MGVTDSKRTSSDSSDSCKSSATIKIKGAGSQKRRTKGETTDAEKKKRKEENGETASSRAKNRGSGEGGRRLTRCPEQLVSSHVHVCANVTANSQSLYKVATASGDNWGLHTSLSHPFSFLLTNKQKEQNNILFELQIRDKSNLNRHLIKDLRIVTVYGVHFSARRYEMNP